MKRQCWIIALFVLVFFSIQACAGFTLSIPAEHRATITSVLLPTDTPLPSPTFTSSATATQEATAEPLERTVPLFDQFIEGIKTGDKNTIVGLWVEGKMALQVVYQPSNNPGFVSSVDNVATYFLLPYKMAGNYGMLAHNYLGGRFFFDVNVGDIIQLVFGDGNYQDFEVVGVNDYQALQPNNPRSEFVNLVSGAQLNANNLFYEVYMGPFHTTLQTCIAQGIEDSWGRRFILAPPL